MSAISFLLWGIALIAFISLSLKTSSLSDQIEHLRKRIRDLEDQSLQEERPRTASPSPPAASPELPRPATVTQPAQPRSTLAESTFQPQSARHRLDWEKTLAENWLVWVGGVTLALGGAFLVKYSIDHGLLLPPVRVMLGLLLGAGLSAGGEWLALREMPKVDAGAEPHIASPVPQALVAAGAATIFSSLYAAYQLYGMIPPGLAFPLLAATAALTVMMSLRRGPFVACLGLIGAFLVPALVHSTQPDAAALFAYLTVVTTASLILLRYKSWWWLAWVTLGGASTWALLWLSTPYARQDATIVCGFLLVLLALFSLVRAGGPASVAWLAKPVADPMVRYVLKAAFLVVSGTLVFIVHIDAYSMVALGSTLAVSLLALWLSYRDADLDLLLGIAPLPYLAVLLSWFTAYAPDQRTHFLIYGAIGGLMFGAGGTLAQGRVARPLFWASLAAAVPLVAYAICYWRLDSTASPLAWAICAAAFGAADLLAALGLNIREEQGAAPSQPKAALVAGALGFSVLAVAIGLHDAWLTMALALHLPVLGWADRRLPAPLLRRLALGIAATVIIRLAINPQILDYPLSPTPILNWLLYGYGVPAGAFFAAALQFRGKGDERLVKTLEAGAILFVAALLTFELRHALGHGRMDFTLIDLGADSSQVLVWLALAIGLYRIGTDRPDDVPTAGATILFVLATAQCLIWQDVAALPVTTNKPVGPWPILDSLLVAYGAPALLYGVIARLRLGPALVWQGARALTLGQGVLWMTLEMRHAFHGQYLAQGTTTEAEWYAYSALWLAYTAACLGAGLHFRAAWLRKTGLLGIGLVVAKVFLFDIANLGGGWRALSFLGLGATLVGTGYAYKRLSHSTTD